MMTQRALSFQLESTRDAEKLTGFAGLSLYLDLMAALELPASIAEEVNLRDKQGWTDSQQVIALLLLQLAGGERVEHLRQLEADSGMAELVEKLERNGLRASEREQSDNRWRIDKQRVFPSPDAAREYLADVDDGTAAEREAANAAYVPERSPPLQGLANLVAETACWHPPGMAPGPVATLDFDAMVAETHKRTAKASYKGEPGFQPMNVYWAQRAMMLHSEFRDGNCPAHWRHLEVLKASEKLLPESVEKLQIRTDTAGYLEDLLKYCADPEAGESSQRFGVIDFAVGVEVSQSFRESVQEVDSWNTYYLEDPQTGELIPTRQEWAVVPFVPEWLGYTKRDLEIRFLAIREPLEQTECVEEPNQKEFSFPTMTFEERGRYKLFGMIDNRPELDGREIISWHRKRCGQSEQVHSMLKTGLAGGSFPSSDDFQANAAWWQISLLAYNLHVLMATRVLGKLAAGLEQDSEEQPPPGAGDDVTSSESPRTRRVKRQPTSEETPITAAQQGRGEGPLVPRMKTERFEWLGLPGRLIRHARQLVLRIEASEEVVEWLQAARERIASFARDPPKRLLAGI